MKLTILAVGHKLPAWVAAGMSGDNAAHAKGLVPDLLTKAEADKLYDYMVAWRQKVAGHEPIDTPSQKSPDDSVLLASPVAPPLRPESISVDHHDPYLVNYRGEPLPGWTPETLAAVATATGDVMIVAESNAIVAYQLS